jgi:succinoglycan biosynthesis protein ExoM
MITPDISPSAPDAMSNQTKHICVCICTYKRPHFLKRLLTELDGQVTSGLFTYSVVVADNDQLQSAKEVATDFQATSAIRVTYCVEPRQNIALTRNKAIENAHGDFVAFIDDDEFPTKTWLLTLFNACNQYGVDGVLGPVNRYFDETPPKWILKGNFYARPSYPTGFVIDWPKGRTGNVLLKRGIFPVDELPFNPEFRNGEDQEFFRRMIERGHKFIWCHEAVAYEVVPPVRWKRRFMLRRALLNGSMHPKRATFGMRDVLKSLIAVTGYTIAIPFVSALGHHRLMELLVSLFDHLGKLLAFAGLNPIKDAYVTE